MVFDAYLHICTVFSLSLACKYFLAFLLLCGSFLGLLRPLLFYEEFMFKSFLSLRLPFSRKLCIVLFSRLNVSLDFHGAARVFHVSVLPHGLCCDSSSWLGTSRVGILSDLSPSPRDQMILIALCVGSATSRFVSHTQKMTLLLSQCWLGGVISSEKWLERFLPFWNFLFQNLFLVTLDLVVCAQGGMQRNALECDHFALVHAKEIRREDKLPKKRTHCLTELPLFHGESVTGRKLHVLGICSTPFTTPENTLSTFRLKYSSVV